jgi:hypothetical protein
VQHSHCHGDPSAQIAALPAGGTFHGAGCYIIHSGIVIARPNITIDGGVYYDPMKRADAGYRGLQPIVKILQVSGTTIKDVILIGANVSGRFRARLVGEAAIKTESATNTTITNVVTANTFGDGLELWFAGPRHPATTNTSVDGLTVLHAGRQGVVPAFVDGLTMNHVNVVSSTGPGINFESDLPGIGAGFVAISNSSFHFVNLIESWSGPILFAKCSLIGHIVVGKAPGTITIDGGSIRIPHQMHGTPSAGIQMGRPTAPATGPAGVLTLNGVRITRDGPTILRPDAPYLGPNWYVGNDEKLVLNHSPAPPGIPGVAAGTGRVEISQ